MFPEFNHGSFQRATFNINAVALNEPTRHFLVFVVMEEVILVDEQDNETYCMEKMQAHLEGLLHRAFPVFIFNAEGELLLPKYHSPGLWTNTCCSLTRPGEAAEHAAILRLQEEMGFSSELKHLFSFVYKPDMGNGLSKYELKPVCVGQYSNTLILNASKQKTGNTNP